MCHLHFRILGAVNFHFASQHSLVYMSSVCVCVCVSASVHRHTGSPNQPNAQTYEHELTHTCEFWCFDWCFEPHWISVQSTKHIRETFTAIFKCLKINAVKYGYIEKRLFQNENACMPIWWCGSRSKVSKRETKVALTRSKRCFHSKWRPTDGFLQWKYSRVYTSQHKNRKY